MAVVTLVANTAYSALSVSNGDTIALAGYRLTIDTQPAETSVSVTTTGTAGKVTISGAYDLSTWSFTAGTSTLIDGSVPVGCTIGEVNGGTSSNASGVATNLGTVTASNGGSASGAYGLVNNNGTVTTVTGGSANSAHGVNNNFGTVTTSNGGSLANAFGIATNLGTVTTSNGGSANNTHGVNSNSGTVTTSNGSSVANAHGVNTNNGTVITSNGGSVAGSRGVSVNYGQVFAANEGIGPAINATRGGTKFVIGPDFHGIITTETDYDPLHTLYTIGPLAVDADIPVGVTIVELSVGAGSGTYNPFKSQVFGGRR